MFLRSKSRQKEWESGKLKSDDKFIFQWCDSLFIELHKKKSDRDFTTDLLESAAKFFSESLTDEEKADCFLYLLGKIIRK